MQVKPISHQIAALRTRFRSEAEFDLVRNWLESSRSDADARKKLQIAACFLYYLQFDTDKDGTPDWTPVVDGRISPVLFPADEDIDGDGIENVLDRDPFIPQVAARRSKSEKQNIPPHLAMQGSKASVQRRLYHNHGLVAIEHSDEHSLPVLMALEKVLNFGLPKGFTKGLPHLKYIYAFSSHDTEVDVAGYHFDARALSIGGENAYGNGSLSYRARLHVINALSHEIGHAFLMNRLGPEEVKSFAVNYGGWSSVFASHEKPIKSFFDPTFFSPHPLARAPINPSQSQSFNLRSYISKYAMTNVHEWFAEAFANHVTMRMGKHGHLGSEWRAILTRDTEIFGWKAVDDLPYEMRAWIEEKILSTRPSPRTRSQPLPVH